MPRNSRRPRLRIALYLAALSPCVSLAEVAKNSRQHASSNGTYSIRLVQSDIGDCRIQVFADSRPEWELPQCLGTVNDLYFISNDAKRFWVIQTIPEKPRPRRKERPDAFMNVNVATLYDLKGKPLRRMRLKDLMQRRSGEKVRQLSGHFEWLQGVGQVPGRAPRVNDQNEVELDLIDSRTVRLKF